MPGGVEEVIEDCPFDTAPWDSRFGELLGGDVAPGGAECVAEDHHVCFRCREGQGTSSNESVALSFQGGEQEGKGLQSSKRDCCLEALKEKGVQRAT